MKIINWGIIGCGDVTEIKSSLAFNKELSPRNVAQGKCRFFISYTIAIRKQFRQKKGSLALTATNFFNETLTHKTILLGPNFTSTAKRTFPFRSICINFIGKFGKLEFKKNNDENNEPISNAPMQ